jgi:hypothetical protein
MGLRPIVLLKSPYIMRLALYLYRILPTNFSNEPYFLRFLMTFKDSQTIRKAESEA